ncbi:MAG: hypothetical protein RLZZ387_4355 [Chloroflexota bacterium]|jgi:aminomethyltransferase
MTASAPADYRAALEGAAFAEEHDAGRIFMRGRDRAALLHRLSTNDIERLRPGQGARTVVTTPIGRILDLLSVYALEDSLLLLTSAGQGPAVFKHLKSNIFFNDQVTLAPAGGSHGQLALYGPAAPALLGRLAGEGAPDLQGLALHHTAVLQFAGAEVLVARREPIGGQGFTLVVPVEAIPALREALVAGGAAPLSAESRDVLRVEQGYGAFGRELSQDYIPLETGLLDAVSFAKGCYVGQEIIARMESRGRLAKRLVGLRLSAELPVLSAKSTGSAVSAISTQHSVLAKLSVSGKEAGDLTSAVVSPRFGPIALAYVRTAHAEPGKVVEIGGGAEGEVVELPFC